MNEMLVRTESGTAVAANTAFDFSWRAVIAGAFVASAVIFFFLFLGAGIGLSLFSIPQANAATAANGLTLGAIYFFAAQAFGLAVGAYIAGRLMGPVLESRDEEIFHASAHGLVTWALAVLMTATMVAVSGLTLTGSGLNAAALLGASNQTNQATSSTSDVTGYWVDTLFRPGQGAVQSASPGLVAGSQIAPSAVTAPVAIGQTENQARAEVGRILTVGLVHGEKLSAADHDQVALLVSKFTGTDLSESGRRVDDVQNQMHQQLIAAAEAARRFTRYISLWLAASLIFGALAASAMAVTGRWIDDEARIHP
jgi:hypothetical protein